VTTTTMQNVGKRDSS